MANKKLTKQSTYCNHHIEIQDTTQRLVTIFAHTVLSSTFDFKCKFNFTEFNQSLMNFNMPEHYNTLYPGITMTIKVILSPDDGSHGYLLDWEYNTVHYGLGPSTKIPIIALKINHNHSTRETQY